MEREERQRSASPSSCRVGESSTEEEWKSIAWLSCRLGCSLVSIDHVENMTEVGGLSCRLLRFVVSVGAVPESFEEKKAMRSIAFPVAGSPYSVVLKTVNPSVEALTRSRELGLAREAFALASLCSFPELQSLLPYAFDAFGDMGTGMKVILMEDLPREHVIQSGLFFGKHSPLNWNRDVESIVGSWLRENHLEAPPTAEYVASMSFQMLARVHAKYWNDYRSLESMKWLRGIEWIVGDGAAEWESAQKVALDAWIQIREHAYLPTELAEDGQKSLEWSPRLLALFEKSFSFCSWERFQDQLKTSPCTLVHGDFHPGNVLWDARDEKLVILDWEVVGVGSGPQDLGQYMISHFPPKDRAACEERLVRSYYDSLVSSAMYGSSTTVFDGYSFEDCWREYVVGGCERWIWLVVFLISICPTPMAQYFHDQLAAFVEHHNIVHVTDEIEQDVNTTPFVVSMPRV